MNKTSLPIPVKVKKIIKENYRTKSFILDGKIKAKPGQFVMIWLPNVGEKPFSLTNDNPFTITVMSIGKFTRYINDKVKIKDQIWYRGPFGDGVFKDLPGKKILVSGGCGCAPIYFFANSLKNKRNTLAIIGAKTKKEIMFYNKFKKIKVKSLICTDDGSMGIKGLTTDILQELANKEKIACVYACGPIAMLKNIAQICKEKKIKFQISLEAIIKCGFGVCGSCSIGGKLVCKDGPVFTEWPLKK